MKLENLIATFEGLAKFPKNPEFNPKSKKCTALPCVTEFGVRDIYPARFDEWLANRYNQDYLSSVIDDIARDFGIARELMFQCGLRIGLKAKTIADLAKVALDSNESPLDLRLAVMRFYGKVSATAKPYAMHSNEYEEKVVCKFNPSYAESLRAYEGEEFRPVQNRGRYFGGAVDYTTAYLVSNYGRLKVLNYTDASKCAIVEGYPAPTRNEVQFHLNNGAFKTCPSVHYMVADAFLEPRDAKTWRIIHLDGDWRNNKVSNLAWVERSNKMFADRA